jgi:hypothetical protein
MEIVGTSGTAEAIRYWLPRVKPLGHGPDNGDRRAFDYSLKRLKLKREVHLFVFLDHEIEKHQIFKEGLAAGLLQTGACWFPTPATARVYLKAVQSAQKEVIPPFGNLRDNESAFVVAIQKIADGEREAGLKILQALCDHIERTGEQKSLVWLMPTIQATLGKFGTPL